MQKDSRYLSVLHLSSNQKEISALLKKTHIPHNVLNAKYHEKEAQIIAGAGQIGAVTYCYYHGRAWYRHYIG